jgi:hypothetical protein
VNLVVISYNSIGIEIFLVSSFMTFISAEKMDIIFFGHFGQRPQKGHVLED